MFDWKKASACADLKTSAEISTALLNSCALKIGKHPETLSEHVIEIGLW